MITDKITRKSNWVVRKFDPKDGLSSEEVYANWRDGKDGFVPYEENHIEGNVLLNEGILALQNLLTGETEDHFGEANAVLGVGDDGITGESAAHTGLQAATNKLYKPMETGFPTINAQTTTWRAVFLSAEAVWDWEEFSVSNDTDDTGDNLNRKESTQGTKANGQTWTLDLAITWS